MRRPHHHKSGNRRTYLGGRVPLVIVAALGRNGAIGHAGALPWRMPGDLARFREMTMGNPMIMGRRTWESIGRPLPGRESIVVTRDPFLELPDGVLRADSPMTALDLAQRRARAMGAEAVDLIGGGMLFEELMPLTDLLFLTYVDLAPAADAFFPEIDPLDFEEMARTSEPRHPQDEAACTSVCLMRIR